MGASLLALAKSIYFMFFYTFEVGAVAVGSLIGAVAGVLYGLAAAAVTGAAVGAAATAGTGAGAAAGTGAGAAAGTGAGAAGGTAAGAAAGAAGGAATGIFVWAGVGALAGGGYACYQYWKEFRNWSAHLKQVKVECGDELKKLKTALEDIERDAKYVKKQANK